jgi:hypothetical protein
MAVISSCSPRSRETAGRLRNYHHGSTEPALHLFATAAASRRGAVRPRLPQASHHKAATSTLRSGGGDHALDPALARRHTQAPKVLNRGATTSGQKRCRDEATGAPFEPDQKRRDGGSAERSRNI